MAIGPICNKSTVTHCFYGHDSGWRSHFKHSGPQFYSSIYIKLWHGTQQESNFHLNLLIFETFFPQTCSKSTTSWRNWQREKPSRAQIQRSFCALIKHLNTFRVYWLGGSMDISRKIAAWEMCSGWAVCVCVCVLLVRLLHAKQQLVFDLAGFQAHWIQVGS